MKLRVVDIGGIIFVFWCVVFLLVDSRIDGLCWNLLDFVVLDELVNIFDVVLNILLLIVFGNGISL